MMTRLAWIAFVLSCALGTVRGQSVGWESCFMVVDSDGGITLVDDVAPVRGATLSAPGKTLTTGDDSFASVVLSNGLTIYCGPQSTLTISRAEQNELVSMYAGGEYEEVRTHIVLELGDGQFAFIQPEPDPISTLELNTRYGRIEGDANQFTLIINSKECLASALTGSLYYFPKNGGTRRFIAEGQSMDMRQADLGDTLASLMDIGARGRIRYQEMPERAEKSAQRTYFTVDGAEPHFVNLVRLDRLNQTAFNDYRLSPQ